MGNFDKERPRIQFGQAKPSLLGDQAAKLDKACL